MMVARKLTHRFESDHISIDPSPSPSPKFGSRWGFRREGAVASPRQHLGLKRSPWLIFASTGGFTLVCVVITYHVLQSILLSERAAQHLDDSGLISGEEDKKTLTFSVCNGMSNQRLSLLYGVMLASELGRAVVLPDFLLSGVQWQAEDTVSSGNNASVPMARLYDVKKFISAMNTVGIEVIDPHQGRAPAKPMEVDIQKMDDIVERLSAKEFKTVPHIQIGCPLFRMSSYYFTGANRRIVWAVLDNLVPNRQLQRTINYILKQLKRLTYHGTFNFVHLRMESDWVLHCKRWETIPDGIVRNNCFNNTHSIDQVLDAFNVSVTEPLYLATFWQQAEPLDTAQVMAKLEAAGYQVATSKQFEKYFTTDREVNALLDFEIALQSKKMMGNSVSTFSALAIFQRRHLNRWATYYNTGNIPMADFLPLDPLPWVFSYNSFNPDLDYLVKAAVNSATRFNTLIPHCMWMGNNSAPIRKWMIDNGVQVLDVKPKWADQLWHKASAMALENVKLSPIFASKDALVNNFMRIEISILPELEQYMYVLFTDVDVFFARKLSIANFPLPLPNVLGMPSDPTTETGVDSGVMLLNMPAMRESYEELKLFMLGNRRGGNFVHFGLGAAGALKQFYEADLKQGTLSPHLSVKPLAEHDPSAMIVHFQGPKPHDYLHFYKTLECPQYGDQCEAGLRKSLCPYMKKWHLLLNETEDRTGISMWYGCLSLYAPHLKGLSKHKLAPKA